MRIVVRKLTMKGTQVAWIDREISADRLRIGRGTDQDVELGDIRVALAQAEISAGEPYRLQVFGTGVVWVNDAPAQGGTLNIGDNIDIGRYRLAILTPELGTDLLISVLEAVTTRDDKMQRLRSLRTRLEHTSWSRRRWAWLLALAVLLAGLAVPATLRYGLNQPKPGDAVWLTRPLSRAHAQFADDCAKCHRQPLQRVANETCGGCHTGVHQHVADPHLAAQPAFNRLQCTQCHFEHHGDDGLRSGNPAICTDCHAEPEAGITGSRLAAVTDFSRSHPPLRPSVPRFDHGHFVLTRPPEAAPRAQTFLRYPHDRHLAPAGIDSPLGRKVLQCADCHQPDEAGRGFRPVTMQAHCASCHKLDFDPAAPQRELPHGKPAEVIAILRDFAAQRALRGGDPRATGDGLRRVPHPQQSSDPALAWAERRGRQLVDDVFDRRVCVYCHVVEKTGDADLPWRIDPVAPQPAGYPHARFNHAPHRAQTCDSCHDARHSSSADDVLLPGIQTCRGCHADPGTADRVPSTCLSCHGFHTAPQAMTAPP